MYKINTCKHKILDNEQEIFIKKTFMEFNFEHCNWISNPKFLNFPYKRVYIGTETMIQINLYMQSLTMDEEQHSKMRNVPR